MDEQVEWFIQSPSFDKIDNFSKKQIVGLADHYQIDIGDQRRGVDSLREILKSALMDQGILAASKVVEASSPVMLTFEQQAALLERQEKIARMSLELEQAKLQVLREQRLVAQAGQPPAGRAGEGSETSNLRLVPRFNECDPDTVLSCLRGWQM